MTNPDWAAGAKARMKTLGLTQEDLCETLGVETRGAVGHYFNGRRKLTVGQGINLATKPLTTVDGLFGNYKGELASVNEVRPGYGPGEPDSRIKEIAELLAALPAGEQEELMEWLRFKARRKTR